MDALPIRTSKLAPRVAESFAAGTPGSTACMHTDDIAAVGVSSNVRSYLHSQKSRCTGTTYPWFAFLVFFLHTIEDGERIVCVNAESSRVLLETNVETAW